MGDQYIGEIKLFPYASFYPDDWLPCDGRALRVNDYQPLFAVIGFTYGGDYSTGFKLPNLQGVAVTDAHAGGDGLLVSYPAGQVVGTPAVAVTESQLPAHKHTVTLQSLGYALEKTSFSSAPVAGASYGGRYWYNLTAAPPIPSYFPYNQPANPTADVGIATPVKMAPSSIGASPGTGGAHENRQPFLALRYCIAIRGNFPVRQ